MTRDGALRWRRAVVTGASSGIGEAFARQLAAAGTEVVLVARDRAKLDDLARELNSGQTAHIEVCAADLATAEGIAAVEALLTDDHQPVDLLVHSAGGSVSIGPFVDQPYEEVEAEILVNVVAASRLMHVAARQMVGRGRGNIVQLSTPQAHHPVPRLATLAATKSFVSSLSEAVAFELRGTPVRVTVVRPGFTRTPFSERLGVQRAPLPSFVWQSPEQVARAGLRAARRGRRTADPGLLNKASNAAFRWSPRTLFMRISERLNASIQAKAERAGS